MTADVAKKNQNETSAEAQPDLDFSPAKALFCGEIVQPSFWPFPEMPGEQKEILEMVLDSVYRFFED